MIWFATWILGHGLSRSSNLGQLRTANPPKNNIKSAKDLLLVKSVWPKKKSGRKKNYPCGLVQGHQERPGAPGTLLAENFLDTNLRAWDFTSGGARA